MYVLCDQLSCFTDCSQLRTTWRITCIGVDCSWSKLCKSPVSVSGAVRGELYSTALLFFQSGKTIVALPAQQQWVQHNKINETKLIMNSSLMIIEYWYNYNTHWLCCDFFFNLSTDEIGLSRRKPPCLGLLMLHRHFLSVSTSQSVSQGWGNQKKSKLWD